MNKRNVFDFSIVIVYLAVCVFAFFKTVGGKGFWVFMGTIGIVGLFWMIAGVLKKRD